MGFFKKNKTVIEISVAGTLMLLILLVVFLVHEYKSMTQTEIQDIMRKAQVYTNYFLVQRQEEAEEKQEKEIFVNGNIAVEKREDSYIWTDYETGERISVLYEKNIATIEKIKERSFYLIDIEEYAKYSYKYLGDMEYEGKNCAVAEYKSENNYIDLFIDKESGFILKEERYKVENKIKKGEKRATYKIVEFKLNQVTDEDILKPDITKYKVIDKRI